MIDKERVIDMMDPPEFRFRKRGVFQVFVLPPTKYNEQYILLKQLDVKYKSVHYYIINHVYEVIGRFDIGKDSKSCGITYHIIDKFQDRGIGQLVLRSVIDDLFSENVDRIRIWPTNEKSAHIAQKNGFIKNSRNIYELRAFDYQEMQSHGKKIS